MKFSIFKDEWYPFYVPDDMNHSGVEAEVPDELIDLRSHLLGQLISVNEEIEKIYNANNESN